MFESKRQELSPSRDIAGLIDAGDELKVRDALANRGVQLVSVVLQRYVLGH